MPIKPRPNTLLIELLKEVSRERFMALLNEVVQEMTDEDLAELRQYIGTEFEMRAEGVR